MSKAFLNMSLYLFLKKYDKHYKTRSLDDENEIKDSEALYIVLLA